MTGPLQELLCHVLRGTQGVRYAGRHGAVGVSRKDLPRPTPIASGDHFESEPRARRHPTDPLIACGLRPLHRACVQRPRGRHNRRSLARHDDDPPVDYCVCRRRKLVDERPAEERSNEAPELSPLEACLQLSLFGGTFQRLGDDGVPVAAADRDDERRDARGQGPWTAEVASFTFNAGVTVHAGDVEGRERLCRYGARPPFSLERLSLLPDGRVAYRLPTRRRKGATLLVMTPVAFLAKIAALVPPPRFPWTRMSGVLAPSSSWQVAVVALGRGNGVVHECRSTTKKRSKKKKGAATTLLAETSGVPSAARSDVPPDGPRAAATSLGDGVVRPVFARIDWASLLKRVDLEDGLAGRCGGRRRVLGDITQPEVITAILTALKLPTEAPLIARARDPAELVAT